jgi:hypothetical protein
VAAPSDHWRRPTRDLTSSSSSLARAGCMSRSFPGFILTPWPTCWPLDAAQLNSARIER